MTENAASEPFNVYRRKYNVIHDERGRFAMGSVGAVLVAQGEANDFSVKPLRGQTPKSGYRYPLTRGLVPVEYRTVTEHLPPRITPA